MKLFLSNRCVSKIWKDSFLEFLLLYFWEGGLEKHEYREMCVEARGQPSGLASLLPPIRLSGLRAMSLSMKPAHRPLGLLRRQKSNVSLQSQVASDWRSIQSQATHQQSQLLGRWRAWDFLSLWVGWHHWALYQINQQINRYMRYLKKIRLHQVRLMSCMREGRSSSADREVTCWYAWGYLHSTLF